MLVFSDICVKWKICWFDFFFLFSFFAFLNLIKVCGFVIWIEYLYFTWLLFRYEQLITRDVSS